MLGYSGQAPSGDEDPVDGDEPVGVGHVERVLQDVRGGEGIQIPVAVVGQHDGCWVIEGQGDGAAGESACGHGVCRVGEHSSGKALEVGGVEEGESHAVA